MIHQNANKAIQSLIIGNHEKQTPHLDKTRLAWSSSAHAPFEQEVIIENPWQIGGDSCFLKTDLCRF